MEEKKKDIDPIMFGCYFDYFGIKSDFDLLSPTEVSIDLDSIDLVSIMKEQKPQEYLFFTNHLQELL